MVTLYTQPTCQPCKAVEKQLDLAGIDYETIDITEDAVIADALKDAGFTGTPVIEYAGVFTDISGLRTVLASARG